MLRVILGLGGISFLISLLATAAMIRLAPRFGFVDKPGGRKVHAHPKPLGGGVAIYLGFVLPMVAGLIVVALVKDGLGIDPAYWSGARLHMPLALTLLAVMSAMHLMGLLDDKKAMGPYSKLLIQLGLIAVVVIPFKEMRILTALDTALGTHSLCGILLAILWIGAITNAFNFLDNMDGLSAGVAAVSTMAFLITTLSIQQWFVAAALTLLLGTLLGFLVWNFPPAKIFMGDSGSLLIGLVLGVLTVRTTYLRPEEQFGAGWYAVLTPVLVLALPLYDLIVVSLIRLSRGKSPFVGDTNHFSHRLVARGMSRRTAVLCLYLITAATAIGAMLLPHVSNGYGAALIITQTALVLCVVALLEQHPLPEYGQK